MKTANQTALVTGITGQDGSYLAELLLAKGYVVHGLARRSSGGNTKRIEHLLREFEGRITLHSGDMCDGISLRRLVESSQPDEVYNLASQSHVSVSFEQAEYTTDVIMMGTLRLLEVLRDVRDSGGKRARFFQASSSEMFGDAPSPHTLGTPFLPRNPYAIAKVGAFWQTVSARRTYGMFAVNGVMHNHESPRRGENFVTRKITRAVGRIAARKQDKLFLGNLDVFRDWGHAKDYVEAAWLMLQQDEPRDYLLATGVSHSVRDWVERAFECAGLNWQNYVEIDPQFYRPAEVNYPQCDPSETFKQLRWNPQISFDEMIREMVEHDCELARDEK